MRFVGSLLVAACAAVAVPVMAHAPTDVPVGAAPTEDACVALQETIDDDARFACADDAGDTWAAWILAPTAGARDLVLTTVHVGARGTRTTRSEPLPGAAPWWPTIAPITLTTTHSGATIDVVRVGFREYPIARVTRAL
jgi:hypothetical protein